MGSWRGVPSAVDSGNVPRLFHVYMYSNVSHQQLTTVTGEPRFSSQTVGAVPRQGYLLAVDYSLDVEDRFSLFDEPATGKSALAIVVATLVDAEVEALGQHREIVRRLVVPRKIFHAHKHAWGLRFDLPRSHGELLKEGGQPQQVESEQEGLFTNIHTSRGREVAGNKFGTEYVCVGGTAE